MALSRAEISRRYRERNLEKVRERERAYDAKRDHAKRSKAWRGADPSKRLAYNASRLEQHSRQEAKRKAAIAVATPSWAEIDDIAGMYVKARATGMEVDHIVPILSPLVCGLHCMANLRIVSERENKSKGNRHWPCMFEEASHL